MAAENPTPDTEPNPDTTPDVPRQPDTEPVAPREPIEVEIVERTQPGGQVVPMRDTALDRAAEAAMQMPGVPGRDEFLSLAMQARVLSMSGLTPPSIRGNPHNAFYIAMIGRDLGLSPTAAIELIDVIGREGRERASLSPQLMNAQIRRLGLGSIIPIVRTAERCVAGAFGPGGADGRCKRQWATGASEGHVDDCTCDLLGTTEFTWDDARTAGLVGVNCQPDSHGDMCGKRDAADRFRCQQGYRTYPKRMMWWRAGGYAADDYFPEAGLGLYSPEELGAMVDDEGRPIDPASVAVPDGYEPVTNGRSGSQVDRDSEADPEDVFELQVRVRALPEAQQGSLRERWKQLNSLQGCSLWRFPARRMQLVQSLVRAVETEAVKGGWDQPAARAAVLEEVGAALSLLFGSPAGDGDEPDPASEPKPAFEPDPSDAPSEATQPTLGEPSETERTWLSPDLAVRNADPDDPMVMNHSDPEEVTQVIERVKELPVEAVDSSLRSHKVRVAGGEDLRRSRLVLAMLRERRAREHEAETGGQASG